MHYAETWPEIRDKLKELDAHDLFVSATNPEIAAAVRADRADAFVEIVENRGRDIRPFLATLRRLRPLGYLSICKIHSKKSAYRPDGARLRKALFDVLLDPGVSRRFADEPKLGLVTPAAFYMPHTDKTELYNESAVQILCPQLGLKFRRARFPAGSMYWFRPEALAALDRIDPDEHWGVERGLADGTWAHAIERIIALLVEDAGYRVDATDP